MSEFDEFDELTAKSQDVLREFSAAAVDEFEAEPETEVEGLQDTDVIDRSFVPEVPSSTLRHPKKEQPAIDSPRVTYDPYKPR